MILFSKTAFKADKLQGYIDVPDVLVFHLKLDFSSTDLSSKSLNDNNAMIWRFLDDPTLPSL